jgi:Tol biopolymer transport system component
MKPVSIAAMVLAMALGAVADDKKANELIQAAQAKETLQGDLKAAIQLYGQAVKEAGPDRRLAVKTLLMMAECYQKMGDVEARNIYEQVVREYADQKDSVALANARLSNGAPASQTKGITARQVWAGPKVNVLGSVSPDGRYISFVDWESGGDLALHDLATGKDRRITNNASWKTTQQFAEESVISPDGKQVAYSWFNTAFRFELRLVNLDGEPAFRTLYQNPEVQWIEPSGWTPDGKWIAVQLARKDRTAQIGLLSTTNGSLRVLKSVDWRGVRRMAFSPDGKYLAYDLPPAEDSEQRDLFLMDVDGSRETPLMAHPANDVVLGWTPDGKYLLFGSNRSGSMSAWKLPVSGGKAAGSPTMVKPDIGAGLSMGMTRTGSLLFAAQAGGSDIYTASIDFQSGKTLSPPSTVVRQPVGNNSQPSWSHDGKLLAFVSQRDLVGNHPTLVITSSDTGEMKEFRPDLEYFYEPKWMPGDRLIAGLGTDRKGRQGIYRFDRQTGEVTPLFLAEPGHLLVRARWALAGDTLYYSYADGNAIFSRDLKSDHEREVVQCGRIGGFTLAPDGRQLTYSQLDPSGKALVAMVVPIAGGEAHEIFRASLPEARSFVPAGWSADSRFVTLFKKPAAAGDAPELWLVPVAGGATQKAPVSLPVDRMKGVEIALHPDGKHIAFSIGDSGQREVWALENLLAGAK